MDLLGRKVVRNGGETVHTFIKKVQETIDQLDTNDPSQLSISIHLKNSLDALNSAVAWMIETFPKQPGKAAAGATSFLEMMGLISGGWMLARGVIEADMQLKNKQGDKNFLNSKITTAQYFSQAFLSRAPSLLYPITDCGDCVMEFEASNF